MTTKRLASFSRLESCVLTLLLSTSLLADAPSSLKTAPVAGTQFSDQLLTLRDGNDAAIPYVDAQIGKVPDELDRLESGDKTIIVFWSDHGFHLGEYDLWCRNPNFERDARVPLIIRSQDKRLRETRRNRLSNFYTSIQLWRTTAICNHLMLPNMVVCRDEFAEIVEQLAAALKRAAFKTTLKKNKSNVSKHV
jgi:glucan phosphoethanolaminetransferase (alkaline phosphatase superfamily)